MMYEEGNSDDRLTNEKDINTIALLFGNIDRHGQLEADDSDLQCLNKLSDFHLQEFNDTIHDLIDSQDDSSQVDCRSIELNESSVNAIDYYDENEMIDEDVDIRDLIDQTKVQPNISNDDEIYDEDYDDECVIVDESVEKMPPPTEVPSILQQRRVPNELETSTNIGLVNYSNINPQNENINHLTTPLASILPPEYANVDIRTLFPHFHHDKIPRWSKLFRQFDEHNLYRPLDAIKNNMPQDNNQPSQPNNDVYYYYNNETGINMGQEPPPEIIKPSETDIFKQPAQSYEDCIVPVPYRDMLPCQDFTNIFQNNDSNSFRPIAPATNNSQVNPPPNSSQNSYQRRMKQQQEATANRKKRKREEKHQKRAQNESETSPPPDELLIGLSWRDGPAKYWYDMYNIPNDANILDYKITPNFIDDSTPILPQINHDSISEEDKLYSWQLYHWESEIIVDPSNFKKEVYDGNRKFAPYAGWIPSFKQRTVASFQDVFSGDYFGICSSTSTGTNLPRPTPDKWHSIFALENVEIIKNDWINQIILDPRQPNAQEPYLLELDLNNEYIHFDFTSSKQTTEILTSELNDTTVCSTLNTYQSNNSNLNGVSASNTASNDNSTITGACVTIDNKSGLESTKSDLHSSTANIKEEATNKEDKQLKKMKLLSKFSDVSELEDKPNPTTEISTSDLLSQDPIDTSDTRRLLKFHSSAPFQQIPSELNMERTIFNLDPLNTSATSLATSATVPPTSTATSSNPEDQSCISSNLLINYDAIAMTTTDIYHPLVAEGTQHSLPAVKLDPFLFPLKVDNQFLRYFHRPRLSDLKYCINFVLNQPMPIVNLKDILKIEEEQREKICQMTGNGDLFFMRSISDLSCTVDRLFFAEYTEEFPPLLNQVGMASRLVNYFCGNPKTPVVMPSLKYGQMIVTPHLPFLGQIPPYQILQSLENNMFRAPIYPHRMKASDFLITLKSNAVFVRRVDDIFTVGQLLPLMEVPSPNSKKANNFLKDFLQVQLIRLFLHSDTHPKTIRHDDIKALFAEQSDTALKKRLKMYADYKKSDQGGGYWTLKPDFQLPTEDELLECINPEECCCYYSMMWGLCRLEDAGYNSKLLVQTDDQNGEDDVDKDALKLEDEVKAAPWHTTKTFLDAQKGKCYLELKGSTDPTGIGEGFSYARISTKASLFKENIKGTTTTGKTAGTTKEKLSKEGFSGLMGQNNNNNNNHNSGNNNPNSGTMVPGLGKRMVTGTDADLRKLKLKDAYALLKLEGISEAQIKKMKRWDIIWMVREMSNLKARQGGDEDGMIKFARSSRLTVADQEERYRNECQRIFSLQNKVLSNREELTSSDDDSSDNELSNALHLTANGSAGASGGDFEGMGLQTNRLLGASTRRAIDIPDSNELSQMNSSSSQLLQMHSSTQDSSNCKNIYLSTSENARTILQLKPPNPQPKRLRIRRYVIDPKTGEETVKSQTISWTSIVQIYFKMHERHPEEYLKSFCGLNQSNEDKEKKLKKKQQEQMRRMKRQQKQKYSSQGIGADPANPIKKKYQSNLQQKAAKIKQNLVKQQQQHHQHQNHQQQQHHNDVGTGVGSGSGGVSSIVCGACGQKGHMRTNKECPNYSPTVRRVKNNNKKTIEQLLQEQSTKNKLAVAASTGVDDNNAAMGLLSVNTAGSYGQSEHNEEYLSASGHPSMSSQHTPHDPTNPLGSQFPSQSIDSAAAASQQDEESDLKLFIPKNLISQYSGSTSANNIGAANGGSGSNEKYSKYKKKSTRGEASLKRGANQISGQSFGGSGQSTNKKQALSHQSALSNSIGGGGNSALNSSASLLKAAMNNDYILDQKMKGNRRRIDPKVALNHQFEEIYKGFLSIGGYRCFLHPVRKRDFPSYYDIVEKPMDLSTVKMHINNNHYQTREMFLQDITLIYENCIKFNGESHDYTKVARQLISHVMEQFCVKERKLMRLERLVNPLMDEDDMVGMKFILQQTVQSMEDVEHSRPFHLPVDRKKYPDYHSRIALPMDLTTLRHNIRSDKYRSRGEFLSDAEIILSNCHSYNGVNSLLTQVAEKMLQAARDKFQEQEATLISLEANLLREDGTDSQVGGESSVMTADHLSHAGDDAASSICQDDVNISHTGASHHSNQLHQQQQHHMMQTAEASHEEVVVIDDDDDYDDYGGGGGDSVDRCEVEDDMSKLDAANGLERIMMTSNNETDEAAANTTQSEDNTALLERSRETVDESTSSSYEGRAEIMDRSGGTSSNDAMVGCEGKQSTSQLAAKSNHERIMADLHLTDSEDEDNVETASNTAAAGVSSSRHIYQDNAAAEYEEDYCQTNQTSCTNPDGQSSPEPSSLSNVKFYIGSGDDE